MHLCTGAAGAKPHVRAVTGRSPSFQSEWSELKNELLGSLFKDPSIMHILQ